MAIEFPCSQCGKLLRVGDEAAGKQARCPSCGLVQGIPAGPTEANPFGPSPPMPHAGETNPYQAPLDLAMEMPMAPAQDGARRPIRPTIISFSDPINSAWEICKESFLLLVMCLVAMIITFVVNFMGSIVMQVIITGLSALGPPVWLVVIVTLTANLAQFVLQTWIAIGQSLFFLKTARGEEASIPILFAGGPYLGSTLLMGLIIGLVVSLIGGVCVGLGFAVYAATGEPVAGFVTAIPLALAASAYLSLTYYPAGLLIVDQGLGALDALRVSKEITTGNRLTFLAIGIVLTLVSIVLCCLPFFTAPFFTLTMTIAYLKMAGQVTADELHSQLKTGAPFASESPGLR